MAILLSDSYKVITWDLSTKALDTSYWGKPTDSGRGCKVLLTQNGVAKTPSTETMRINFKKPSGLKVFEDGVISGNYFVFDFKNQVYAEVGIVYAELMLNVSSKFIMSSTFPITVTQDMTDGIASTSEFDALTDALADVDEVKADIVALENPTFTEAVTLANVNSGELLTAILGKIKKLFSFIGTDISKLASVYSASSTYGTGAYVTYDNKLYRCTTAITVAEAFNIAKWTESNFSEWSSLRITNSVTKGTNINAVTANVVEKTASQVHINFACSPSSAIATGEVVGIIPVGYRPTVLVSAPCQLINNATVIGYTTFSTNGNITFNGNLQSGGLLVSNVSFTTVI